MRILIHSVKPTIPTGYGSQTKLWSHALKGAGHEVAVSALAGQFGSTELVNDVMVFPHSNHTNRYGFDTVTEHFMHWKADVVWSFTDSFILNPQVVGCLPWAAWTPADSDPLMPLNIPALAPCKWIVACSRFGQRVLQDAFPKRDIFYVPCAYDPEQYHLMPIEEAYTIVKNILGFDLRGVPVVNMVSANSGARKNFWAAFEAWKKVKHYFSKAMLVIHAERTGYFGEGADLIQLMKLAGLELGKDVLFSPHWLTITGQLPPAYLCALHNISICHLNTCLGEGFGLPVVEAQACGCPVVVPAFGAVRELVGPGSVEIDEGWRINSVPGTLQFAVDPNAVAETLCDFIARPATDRHLIPNFVAGYEVGRVLQAHMLPTLGQIKLELDVAAAKKKVVLDPRPVEMDMGKQMVPDPVGGPAPCPPTLPLTPGR